MWPLNVLARARRFLWRHSATADAPALDRYVHTPPSASNAIDIFHGLWASKLPAPFDQLSAGSAGLFEDPRVAWGLEQLGGVRGARVLELGPLEGGHSYMLDRGGAKEVIAIEGNTQAYLRCLVVKEVVGLPSVHFHCGDFVAYLRDTAERFDLCVASGVLYHMQQPVELLARIAAVSDRTLIWTHYYDAELLAASAQTAHRVVDPIEGEHGGYRHRLYRYEYGPALDAPSFCGGNRPFAYWLSRDDIIGALRHFGFAHIAIGHEQTSRPNGPAFTIAAWK